MAKKKPGRKPKKKLYFGMEVQDAIVRYNDTDKPSLKNKIYQEEIHAAFDKLCENIINTFKFEYFDDVFVDVKQEVTSFLVMNMHKYDHTKGAKAFSYFSVVAKNYLILHNNANYKKYKSHYDTSVLDSQSVDHGKESFKADFFQEMIKYFDMNITNIFKKKRDIDIAFSILELMKKSNDIENFNKKALYILIREMTGVETVHITHVTNVMKKHYNKINNEFSTKGYVSNKKSFF